MRFEVRQNGVWIYSDAKGPIRLSFGEAIGLHRFLEENHRSLRPSKRWDLCPYVGHSDDCDCRGMGGDQ